MLIPAAMNIESAMDEVKTLSEFMHTHQLHELESAVGGTSQDFQRGYELGLQTARVILAGSAALLLKAIDPSTVL